MFTAFQLPESRPPTHPGEMLLEEFLKPLGLTQRDFARHIGWTQARLNELIKGKRGVTYEAALDLGDVLKMPAYFWLELQMKHNLWHAMRQHQSKEPLPQMSDIDPDSLSA